MYDPLRLKDSRIFTEIWYKISESFKFNEIYLQSTVGCAESDGQRFISKLQSKVSEIIIHYSTPDLNRSTFN